MLIDHMVEYCDSMYKKHVNDHPCNECNHPTGCKGDCLACLDEVHWLKPCGRRDYNCEHLLYYYTCRYSYKYCSEIIYALEEIDLDNYPRYDILSLGCGAAPDLMAFDYLNRRTYKPIRYIGYDRNPLWKEIHDEIEGHTTWEYDSVDVKFKCQDVFSSLTNDKERPNYNVIIMQYFLSHLYNTCQISEIDDLYDSLIENVLTYRRDDSPFLIIINDIDSCHKGRDHFWPFQQKIQHAGFHTDVNARCFKGNVYLENAEQYNYDINKFSIPESIKEYYKCAIRCESAQLIIEVR